LAGPGIGALVLTGNYPDPNGWADDQLLETLNRSQPEGRRFVVLIDTLMSRLVDEADVVLPGGTWAGKGGTLESAKGTLQGLGEAIGVLEGAKAEGQIAIELRRAAAGEAAPVGAGE